MINNPFRRDSKIIEHLKKIFFPSGFQGIQLIAVAAAMILGFLFLFSFRDRFAAILPAISAITAFSIFLLPGLAVTFWLLPRIGLVERLPIAFITSVGIMIIPGVLVMKQHLSLDIFASIFSTILIIAALGLLAFFAGHTIGYNEFTRITRKNSLLIIALFSLALGILYTSSKVPMIGDDWAGIVFLQNFLASDAVNLYEPFHGTGYPPTSRSEFGVWGLDLALLVRISGLDIITYYTYMRMMMTLIGLVAFYAFAHQVLSRRNAAVFATAFWMITLLATIVWGDPGYDLVARINQDKFAIRYILLPIALFFLLRYFQTHKLRNLVFFGLICWTSGGMHPIGPIIIGLPCLGFGLFHLALERDKRTLAQLALALIFFGLGMILPTIQFLGVEEGWLAFSLQDATDPSLLIRLGMATRAGRLWLLQNAGYILHPAAIIEPIFVIALLFLPFLVTQLRKNISARLLLGSLVVIPLLLYLPLTGKSIGVLVTPWMLYRLLWPVSMVAVVTIGWVLFIAVDKLNKSSVNYAMSSLMQTIIPLGTLIVLGAALATSIKRGQVYLEDVSLNPDLSQCQEATPILKHLPEFIENESIVLADHDLNFCIPAFSPHAKVLEYRWTSTLSRFPIDHRDEALERVKDMMYFTSARFVDKELESIFLHYDVQYILIKEEKSLNSQIRHLTAWFDLIAQENQYALYKVKNNLPTYPIVEANTALVAGNGESARMQYEALIGQSPNIDLLAHLGLSEYYLNQGEIDIALEELKSALVNSPHEGTLLAQLADTFVAAGRVNEAITVYESAVKNSPENEDYIRRLGLAYQLSNQPEKARSAYKELADLQAPSGSARWFRVLGSMYTQAGWHNDAIDAYNNSLAVLPQQVDVEISIGDVYFKIGDLERARDAFQQAAGHDLWDAGPIMRLGILDEREGNTAGAIDNYKRAIALSPTKPAGYVLLAEAILLDDGVEFAIQTLQSLPGYELLLPGPYLASGTIYAVENNYDQAIAELELAINRFPLDTSNLMTTLGTILSNIGQDEEAKKLLQDAIIADPAFVDEIHILEGKILTEQVQLNQALGSFYTAVRTNPISAIAHLSLGNGFANLAQYEMAKEEYLISIALQPGLVDGYTGLGEVYLSSGEYQHAIEMFTQAISHSPHDPTGYRGLARVYQKQGRFDEAIQAYQDAESRSPESSTIHVSLARVYQAVGELDEALAQYVQAVEIDPDNPAVQKALGYFRLANHDTGAAVETFRKSIELHPHDGQSRVGLANALLIAGNFDEALEQFQIAAENGDWIGNASTALGDEYRRRANWDDAETAYLNAIQADPTLVDAYIHLGDLYAYREDWNAASEFYQAAINADPTSAAALVAFGTAMYEHGQVEDGLEILEQALELEPTNIEVYNELSRLLRFTGQADEALALIEQLLLTMPGSADSWQTMANFRRDQGQWDQALVADQQAVAIEPGNVTAWISLGNSYQGQGHFIEAEDSFLRAIELQTGYLEGYLALGDLYRRIGNFEQAEEIYDLAVKVDLSQASPYLKLAELYTAQDRVEEAEIALLWAQELAPSQEQGYLELGGLYENSGDLAQALVQYEKALQIMPGSANASSAIGAIYQHQGEWPEAKRAYDNAALAQPRRTIGWISLADYFRTQGEFVSAENYYLEAVAANPADPAGYLGLGSLYREQGRMEKSLAQFLAAIENAPGSQYAHIALGDWHKEHGNWELAEKSYREAIFVRPIEVGGYIALGSFFEDTKDNLAAEQLFKSAIELAPSEVSGYLSLGKLNEELGFRDTAENVYRQAISIAPVNPEGYLHLGALFSSEENWGAALEEYKTAAEVAPTSVSAFLSLGDLYQKLAVFKQLREVNELSDSPDQIELNLDDLFRGLNYNTNFKSKAISSYGQALEISPTNLDAYAALAQMYVLGGDYDQAQYIYADAILHTSSTSGALISRAEFYAAIGEWEQAQADYESAWSINPLSLAAGLKITRFYRGRGDFELALGYLDNMIQSQMINAYTQTELGNTLADQGNFQEAIKELEHAILLQENLLDPYLVLARIYELQGEREKALGTYQSAAENAKYSSEAFTKLGDFQQIQGSYSDAQDAFEFAFSLDPTNPKALVRLDQINVILNAEMDLSEIIDPNNLGLSSESLISLSYLNQQDGEWEAAELWLKKAIRLDPLKANNWVELGSLYMGLENWDLAQQAFTEALKYDPLSVSPLLSLGFVQEQLAMSDSALETYQRAVDIVPGQIDGYIALANAQFAMGEAVQSVQTMQEGISRVPADYRGYQTLGKLYSEMGATTSAVEVYQAGLEMTPGAAQLYIGIGNTYSDKVFEASNALETARAFENAAQYRVGTKEEEKKSASTRRDRRKSRLVLIHAVEEFITAQNKLIIAQRNYQQSGTDRDLATINYHNALDIQPNDDAALRGLGKLALTSKSPEEALIFFSQAVNAHPDSILSLIYLGFSYLDLNQSLEAIDIFTQLLKLDSNNMLAHMGIKKSYAILDTVEMSQAAATIEHSQFFWDSLINTYRLEDPNFGGY